MKSRKKNILQKKEIESNDKLVIKNNKIKKSFLFLASKDASRTFGCMKILLSRRIFCTENCAFRAILLCSRRDHTINDVVFMKRLDIIKLWRLWNMKISTKVNILNPNNCKYLSRVSVIDNYQKCSLIKGIIYSQPTKSFGSTSGWLTISGTTKPPKNFVGLLYNLKNLNKNRVQDFRRVCETPRIILYFRNMVIWNSWQPSRIQTCRRILEV